MNFDDNRFPWMLALWLVHLTFKAPTCGAALVSNRHAITAAHCVNDVGVRCLDFVKFKYSEKVTKICKNLPFNLTLHEYLPRNVRI